MLRLLLTIMLLPSAALSGDITGREIIKRMDELMRGASSVGLYEMEITTPHWTRRLRLRAYEKGREKTFVRILYPPKERGVATLRIGYEMWNYFPKIERVIKIPPSMMLNSWMGSDFTNDDIVRESSRVNDYVHKNLGRETMEGREVWKVESRAKEDAPVVWDRIISYVRTDGFIPVKEEFYSERGELVRVLTFSAVKEMGGRTIPTRWEMRPVKKNRKTVFTILEVEFDVPIDDGIFTIRHMKSMDWR